jgi:hypothetical protein
VNTQDKFTAAAQKLADEREGIELVIDKSWANVGTYSFEREGEFEPILVVPFSFNNRSGDFAGHGTNNVLGRNLHGGCFTATEGEGYELVLQRIGAILDGEREPGEDADDWRRQNEAVERREERARQRRGG